MIDTPLKQRVVAEAVGTALLLAIVVGSGIMGERLSAGNTGIALLANSLATGAGLGVLILTFAPVSGAHFNPMVTLVQAFHSRLGKGDAAAYIAAQIGGAFVGVAVAHAMFGLPLLEC
ncbi:MAG TPA: aquaporin, partial [Candidatus Udaeobacter sp.]|nr:aquaporin [Candidatus Udaeobacter sp.]